MPGSVPASSTGSPKLKSDLDDSNLIDDFIADHNKFYFYSAQEDIEEGKELVKRLAKNILFSCFVSLVAKISFPSPEWSKNLEENYLFLVSSGSSSGRHLCTFRYLDLASIVYDLRQIFSL